MTENEMIVLCDAKRHARKESPANTLDSSVFAQRHSLFPVT